MNEITFKKINKPAACASAPWADFIPPQQRPEILRTIRNETIEHYGHSMDECPKRLTCLKKHCQGRPLPWKSPTALPYLQKLQQTQNIVNEELIIATDCSKCPIYTSCSSPCNQVSDFLDRHKLAEPIINYYKHLERVVATDLIFYPSQFKVTDKDIPWDVLTPARVEIIKKYLFEEKDYKLIAAETDKYNEAYVKYEFYAGLTKLSKYAAIRLFLKHNKQEISDKAYQLLFLIYMDNKTIKEAGATLGVTKQAAQQLIKRYVKKFKIKWYVFVKKENNQPIYNVPNIIR
jgi:hypothetical protein